jgi:MtrB/PioB family decaheme-associated outer membrane protein
MKLATNLSLRSLVLLVVIFAAPSLFSQEEPTDRGFVEFGGRYVWGEVYGRPDLLPFQPPINTSKFNEYRDLRSGVFIRRMNLKLDNLFDSRNYFHLQSQSSFYRDQSYLASFGSYGRFVIQFRYDETPHTFTNTTRTFYTQSSPGVFVIPLSVRTTLSTTANADIPFTSLAQVADMAFITPALRRKKGTALVSVNPIADWNLFFQFSRENMIGTRPIAMLFNSTPSTSLSSGAGVEVPESIDYFTNTVSVGTEYGRENWGLQFSYLRSSFENNIDALVFDNPYRLVDAAGGPAFGVADLYPSNHADYLNFAGSFKLGKHMRFLASISPGWLRQNDPFLPYTSNSVRLAATGPLPATSLDGRKQTLAMNYTLVTKPVKKFQIKAGYRHYDYNNDTPVLDFTPVQGDTGAPGSADNQTRATSFNKKTFELTGNWFFAKRSSVKVGYEGEWFDRTHRDVENSKENSFIAAVDWSPNKDLLFRVAYRHSDRDPEHYEDELSDGIECEAGELAAARAAFEFPDIHPCARRFDEAARLRDRGEISVQYNATDKLSLGGSFTTIQDDYNRPGGTNSATPLNFLTGSAATTNPYYLYGMLKDISFNYTFDASYAIAPEVSFFAEYSREKYHRTMTSRFRQPQTGNGCGVSSTGVAFGGPCDSSNNDWYSAARDTVDVLATGVDLYLGKRAYITTYYSLAATKGQVFTRALGTQPANFLTQPTRRDGTDLGVNPEDRFMMTTTSAATDYPDTVNRSHEFVVLFKFKASKNFSPKLEYRYQQFDYKDYQTSPMTQFVGCVSTTGVPAAGGAGGSPSIAAITANGCPVFGPTAATSFAIPFYPFTAVGDTGAARFFFLGVDQPSYKAHHFSASLEYRF